MAILPKNRRLLARKSNEVSALFADVGFLAGDSQDETDKDVAKGKTQGTIDENQAVSIAEIPASATKLQVDIVTEIWKATVEIEEVMEEPVPPNTSAVEVGDFVDAQKNNGDSGYLVIDVSAL